MENKSRLDDLYAMANGSFHKPGDCKAVGLTYSSVSRRVGIVRKQLREDKLVKDKLDGANALIKL